MNNLYKSTTKRRTLYHIVDWEALCDLIFLYFFPRWPREHSLVSKQKFLGKIFVWLASTEKYITICEVVCFGIFSWFDPAHFGRGPSSSDATSSLVRSVSAMLNAGNSLAHYETDCWNFVCYRWLSATITSRYNKRIENGLESYGLVECGFFFQFVKKTKSSAKFRANRGAL